jgi:hypothetical protein
MACGSLEGAKSVERWELMLHGLANLIRTGQKFWFAKRSSKQEYWHTQGKKKTDLIRHSQL